MDAFAASIASGVTITRDKVYHAIRIAFSFGSFQALMPLTGWYAGSCVRQCVSGIDHWIACGILSAIGAKMIYDGAVARREEDARDPLNVSMLLMLSVATSIDAFAVGMSLSFLNVGVLGPALVIGMVTFALSFIGVFVGTRFGRKFGRRVEIAGGLVLIFIGIKIVAEHLG